MCFLQLDFILQMWSQERFKVAIQQLTAGKVISSRIHTCTHRRGKGIPLISYDYFYLCWRIYSLRIFRHNRSSCKNQFSARLLPMHYRDPRRCDMAVNGMSSGSGVSSASCRALWKEWGHHWNEVLEAQIAIKATDKLEGACWTASPFGTDFGEPQFKCLVYI